MPLPRLVKALGKKDGDRVYKAFKDGKISKKQYEKMPPHFLLGIVKKGDSKGGIKETRKKIGKQAHKRGRPKGGSKVKIVE